MMRSLYIGLSLAAAGASAPSLAATAPDLGCYDLKVYAKVVGQIPSEIPECADCIITHWPWFLDLKVRRVVEGRWKGKVLKTLAIQHTYLRSHYGIWLLRQNNVGGYNVLQSRSDGVEPGRCSGGAEPVTAYLQPGAGDSLDAMRNVGERLYGHHPN